MTTTSSTTAHTVVTYDAEARASYQYMSDKPVARTVEREDGSLADFAADGTLVGIETLYAKGK